MKKTFLIIAALFGVITMNAQIEAPEDLHVSPAGL